MTTKRTPIRRDRRARLTPEALACWLVIREIAESPTDRDEYEPVGRHREYVDLNIKLCRLIGLEWTYMNFPIEIDSPTPPLFMNHNPPRAENWRQAWRWRCLLMQAEGDYERREQAKGFQLAR